MNESTKKKKKKWKNQYVLKGCWNVGPSDYENLNHKTENVNEELH